jgi:hypothetical protein
MKRAATPIDRSSALPMGSEHISGTWRTECALQIPTHLLQAQPRICKPSRILAENAVSAVRFHLVAIAVIALAQSGCGTMHNLMAHPKNEPREEPYEGLGSGPGDCVPFGGVARSAVLGFFGTPTGISVMIGEGIGIVEGDDTALALQRIGNGMMLAAAGLIAIADTPLSLAGDVVTWPVANARETQQPWATWWRTDPGVSRILFGAASPRDDKKPGLRDNSQ